MTRSRIPENDDSNYPEEGSLVPRAIEMLVERTESRLEDADTLAEALRDLTVPQIIGIDLYDTAGESTTVPISAEEDGEAKQDTDQFPFNSMIKFFLYEKVKDISDKKLQEELDAWPHRVRWFGANRAPRQQTFSYTWDNRFTPQTRHAIEIAAEAIGNAAADEGVIREALAPRNLTDEDTEDDGTPKREYKRKQTNKTVKLARQHALPNFETGRADNKKYPDEYIFEMHARMCTTQTAAHTEGEVGWLTDDDYTPDGSTFLRAVKQVGQSETDDQNVQFTVEDCNDFDEQRLRQIIASVRDDVLEGFDSSTENIIKSIQGENVFDDRVTIAAIDITPEPFHPTPWKDKDEGIPKEDFPRMVSGYKKNDGVKRGYKYATLTLAGDVPPIILGVEPVKHNSEWEPKDSLTHSNAELVDRLLTKAQQYTDIDMVLYDRGINCSIENGRRQRDYSVMGLRKRGREVDYGSRASRPR